MINGYRIVKFLAIVDKQPQLELQNRIPVKLFRSRNTRHCVSWARALPTFNNFKRLAGKDRLDHASANHIIAIVEDHRLARSNRPFCPFEHHTNSRSLLGIDRRGRSFILVPNLYLNLHPLWNGRQAHHVNLTSRESVSHQLLLRTNMHSIGFLFDFGHIDGFPE